MLIIEGTDQLGKTTLCKRVLSELPDHIFASFTRLPSGFNYLTDYMARASTRVVQDRFHMSEIAYSYARGELESPLRPYVYNLVDAYLRLYCGAFTVVLYTSCPLSDRWQDRDEMYSVGVAERANQVFQFFATHSRYIYVSEDVYTADCDYAIDVKDGYVSDDQVKQIVSLYLSRYDQFENLRRRSHARPNW